MRFRDTLSLLDTFILNESLNYQNIADLAIDVIIKNNLKPLLLFYVTDNVSYAHKPYNDIISKVCPDTFHLGRWAHIIDLVGETWREHFTFAQKFMSITSIYFKRKVGTGRKRRFHLFQRQHGMASATFLPAVSTTRRSSWLRGCSYYKEKLNILPAFLLSEKNITGGAQTFIDFVSENYFKKLNLNTVL